MKVKYILATALMALFSITMMGQAKKPTLMVFPSEAWCKANGFVKEVDNQGTKEIIPDIKAAVTTDMELTGVISKINNLMADRGFPLEDLQQTLKSMNNLTAEERLIASKSGNGIAESDLDRIRRVAKADIILELEWSVVKTGPKSSVRYNLRGLDAYSNKQVAGAEGIGKGSFSADVPVLLEEAVQDHMDEFVARLQSHFDDILANGREISIDILTFDGTIDLETEYDDKELVDVINDWLADNTIQHRYSLIDNTESRATYRQVRMPMYRANGQAQAARDFVGELRKFLRGEPYNIQSKLVNQGLGRCSLILGEK